MFKIMGLGAAKVKELLKHDIEGIDFISRGYIEHKSYPKEFVHHEN